MKSFRRQSLADQAADYLRNALAARRWRGVLPGIRQLTAELKVSRTCLDRALAQLTREGLIEPGDAGHPRRIVAREGAAPAAKIRRVGCLLDIPLYHHDSPTRESVIGIRDALQEKGIEFTISRKTIRDLSQPRSLLPGLIGHQQADCWLVLGASLEVIQWFTEQPFPCLALGGRNLDIPVASVGYDVSIMIEEALDHLIAAGHQRIVMPVPKSWQADDRGPCRGEARFRERMEKAGLRVGPFNLPMWDDTPAGWLRLLDELYTFTPPTALLLHSVPMFVALQSFLIERGLRIPADLSVVLLVESPALEWIRPAPSYFERPCDDFVNAVVKWVERLGAGPAPKEKVMLRARFHEGATIAVVGGRSAKSTKGVEKGPLAPARSGIGAIEGGPARTGLALINPSSASRSRSH